MRCPFTDLGLVTTPMLHHYTMKTNLGETPNYLQEFTQAFLDFQNILKEENKFKKNYEAKIAIDCANGVGAKHLKKFAKKLSGFLQIISFNKDMEKKDILNYNCGAEHVQKENALPTMCPEVEDMEKFASFDGDADRLIYFWKHSGEARVVDGDKQFALLSLYIQELLVKLKLPDGI